MANVYQYSPLSVSFPEEFGLERVFYKNKSQLKDVDSLDESDKVGYETTTVFHDLFLTDNPLRLDAIGPPALNFSEQIINLQLVFAKDTAATNIVKKVQITNKDRISFFKIDLTKAVKEGDELIVIFPCGYQQKLFFTSLSLPDVTLQVTTLQKNNPLQWMGDWISYFQGMGAQRVVLYDNNSDNFSEILPYLKTLSTDIDIVLISWPFVYGPIRSNYNKFCQAGQNNHACQFFNNSQWSAHFDLDEYPVLADGQTLVELLNSQNRFIGNVRIDSYMVTNVTESQAQDYHGVTARDFVVRERKNRKKGHKYCVRLKAYREAKTHNAYVKLGYYRKTMDANSVYFLHYRGLTNNWKTYVNRSSRETFDEAKMVEDKSVFLRMQPL